MQIPFPGIFKNYDIRGIIDVELTESIVEAIGRAYGSQLRRHLTGRTPHVAVGHDCRQSGKRLYKALEKGLLGTGVNVTYLGMCPTPAVYFAHFHHAVDGVIQITGSHNPGEYNGLKMCVGRETLFGERIQALRQIIENEQFETGTGKVNEDPINEAYTKHLVSLVKPTPGLKRPLKVVVDAGNATAGLVAPQVIRKTGAEVIELFCDLDERFPNHHPDPTLPDNLKSLIAKVRETKADLGLAYDGDMDRLGVVDETGRIRWGDELLTVYARDLLKRHPQAVVIGEVKCSQVMYDAIEAMGGRPIMWRTGHSLIKQKMKQEGALLAGEMSGHLFFAENYFGFDDALYASLVLMRIVAEHLAAGGQGLSELFKDLPQVFVTPEIRTNTPDEIKFDLVEAIRGRIEELIEDGSCELPIRRISEVDGVRVEVGAGWGLVRASHTQPILVSRFEARDQQTLEKYQKFLEGIIEECKSELLEA